MNLECWIIFVLYWLVTARNVKPTKQEKSGFGYVRWFVIAVAAFLLLPNALSGGFGPIRLLPASDILLLVSVLASAAGLAMAILARRKLAGNWSSGIVLKKIMS
jgi:hypothetical protein